MVAVANWTVPPSSAVPTGSSIFKRQVSASGDSRTELMTARTQSEADVQVGKLIDRSWPVLVTGRHVTYDRNRCITNAQTGGANACNGSVADVDPLDTTDGSQS